MAFNYFSTDIGQKLPSQKLKSFKTFETHGVTMLVSILLKKCFGSSAKWIRLGQKTSKFLKIFTMRLFSVSFNLF